MYRLLKIRANNFLSWKKLNLDVRKSGLYLISGQNEKGGDSNGSGKSSIIAAVSYALFGRTPKGVQGSDVVMWGSAGSMEVDLSLVDEGGAMLRVTRGIEKFTVEVQGSVGTGKELSGSKRDLQKQLEDIIKTDFFLFVNSCCFSQGEGEFLCEAGDSDKKRLLKTISGLEAIDKMYASLKLKLQKLETVANTLTVEVENSSRYLVDLTGRVEQYEKQEEGFEGARRLRIANLEKQLGSVPHDTVEEEKKVAKCREKLTLSESGRSEAGNEEEITYGLERLRQHSIALSTSLRGVNGLLDKLEGMGSNCDICGSELTRKSLASRRRTLTSEADTIKGEGEATLASIRAHELTLSTVQAWTADIETSKRDLFEAEIMLENKVVRIEEEKERVKTILASIEQEKATANPFAGMLSSLLHQIEQAETILESKRVQFKQSTTSIDNLGFLKWVMSREGVASFIIEKTFGRLEQLANYYLGSLSQEGFRVQIKPQREKKDGGIKEEIDIKVLSDVGLIPYWNLSDGQRQRVNIALLIATHKLCQDMGLNKLNFLLLDEVLDLSLDQQGQEDVIRFVRVLLQDIHHIFVVSHKPDISSSFDYEISVNRTLDGCSHTSAAAYE